MEICKTFPFWILEFIVYKDWMDKHEHESENKFHFKMQDGAVLFKMMHHAKDLRC